MFISFPSYTAELAKTRQVAAAADKLRREKWRAEETQRIKEATVKSLEPEIQRIIAKGKAEIQKLKALHEVNATFNGVFFFNMQSLCKRSLTICTLHLPRHSHSLLCKTVTCIVVGFNSGPMSSCSSFLSLQAELLQSDERAGRRFVAQMEELRAQCAAEKEQACAHERELARQR